MVLDDKFPHFQDPAQFLNPLSISNLYRWRESIDGGNSGLTSDVLLIIIGEV